MYTQITRQDEVYGRNVATAGKFIKYRLVDYKLMLIDHQEGVRIDWMSNVERLHIDKDKEAVDVLMNKYQRHRGDTLNSGMYLVWAGMSD